MNDPRLWKSTQSGKVRLWRYLSNRNFAGWHLSADPAGIDSLVRVCDALRDTAERPAESNIAICRAEADDYRVPSAEFREADVIRAIRFHMRAEHDAPEEFWSLEEENGEVLLRMGLHWLERFRQEVSIIHNGGGDTLIGTGDPAKRLWFWW